MNRRPTEDELDLGLKDTRDARNTRTHYISFNGIGEGVKHASQNKGGVNSQRAGGPESPR